MKTSKIKRQVRAVASDAHRAGHCNGCTTDDRRVAECEIGGFTLRLCAECATQLVERLRAIPAFVKETP